MPRYTDTPLWRDIGTNGFRTSHARRPSGAQVRNPSECEATLCIEGADYPIGTDEGRHATKYGGDGATALVQT